MKYFLVNPRTCSGTVRGSLVEVQRALGEITSDPGDLWIGWYVPGLRIRQHKIIERGGVHVSLSPGDFHNVHLKVSTTEKNLLRRVKAAWRMVNKHKITEEKKERRKAKNER